MKKVKVNTRQSVITVEHLARNMDIGLEKAKHIMIEITQKVIKTTVHPITRQYRVYHVDLHTARLAGKCYFDWILSVTKSMAQNSGALVFSECNFY